MSIKRLGFSKEWSGFKPFRLNTSSGPIEYLFTGKAYLNEKGVVLVEYKSVVDLEYERKNKEKDKH